MCGVWRRALLAHAVRMLRLRSDGTVCALAKHEARGVRVRETYEWNGVRYSMHAADLRLEEGSDAPALFDLALPAPFGAKLVAEPVAWSWSKPGVPTEGDLSALLAHLMQGENIKNDPIVLRDALGTQDASPAELALGDRDDDIISENDTEITTTSDEEDAEDVFSEEEASATEEVIKIIQDAAPEFENEA